MNVLALISAFFNHFIFNNKRSHQALIMFSLNEFQNSYILNDSDPDTDLCGIHFKNEL